MKSLDTDYRVTPIGKIPFDWEITELGSIAKIMLGRTPERKEAKYWEAGVVPWVSIADLNNGIVTKTNEEISRIAFEELLRNRLSPTGTLLLSFKLTIGKVGILGVDATHNEAIASIFQDNSKVDRDYLFFHLQNMDYDAYLDAYVKGRTLNKNKLSRLLISLPPLPEQRAIAKVLRTVQQAIDATERVITAARELKRSMMKYLFTYGPVPVYKADKVVLQETEFGEVPMNWQVIQIKDMGEVITGSTPSTKEEKYYGGKYKLISPANLNEKPCVESAHRWLTEDGLNQSRVLPKDTVLVSCIGYIGKTGITTDDKSATNQQINAVVCNEDTNPKFAYYALTNLQKYMENRARVTTVPILNKNVFQNLKIAKPPYEIQLMLANKLDAITRKIEYETDVKLALENLFGSLLHHLMTGKVRVPHEQ